MGDARQKTVVRGRDGMSHGGLNKPDHAQQNA
jgi:hypothetical protein